MVSLRFRHPFGALDFRCSHHCHFAFWCIFFFVSCAVLVILSYKFYNGYGYFVILDCRFLTSYFSFSRSLSYELLICQPLKTPLYIRLALHLNHKWRRVSQTLMHYEARLVDRTDDSLSLFQSCEKVCDENQLNILKLISNETLKQRERQVLSVYVIYSPLSSFVQLVSK